MAGPAKTVDIEVAGGAVPTALVEPEAPGQGPALVVVPSIFGPAPDLLERLAPLAADALVAVPDPFWRVGGGAIAYHDRERAFGRLQGFDLRPAITDLEAVLAWARARGNGRVVGLGICFGGPFVLRFAGQGQLDGGATWHGSRMENFLDRAAETRCPLRLHFGADDPISPPPAIEKIRRAFADHPDCEIAVHPGAVHGYSHDGDAWDPAAYEAGHAAVRDLLEIARRERRGDDA